MPKIVKGGTFGLFENPVSCKISKNLKGGTFADMGKLSKKKQKMINLSSFTVPKNVRRGHPLGIFNIHSVAKDFLNGKGTLCRY